MMWFPVRLGLGPAPRDAAVNNVVPVTLGLGPAPGVAAVNDVVSC